MPSPIPPAGLMEFVRSYDSTTFGLRTGTGRLLHYAFRGLLSVHSRYGLHARQQVGAMLDTETGEVVSMTVKHEGNNVREFYSKFPHPVRVGIEATGSMQWFVNLMEELGIECLVGHPAQIRAAATEAET